jgi:predicted phosphodiesterase
MKNNLRRLVADYIQENNLGQAPKQTIARDFLRAHPHITATENSVRHHVRNILGVESNPEHGESVKTGQQFYIPKTWKTTREKYELPEGKWAVLNDIHLPYHDPEALLTALEYVKSEDVTGILLNGDLADFYSISSHAKKWDGVSLTDEIEAVRDFLLGLRRSFGPDVKIIWKLGNHENRLFRDLNKNAPYIAGLLEMNFGPNMAIEHFFGADVANVKVIHDQTIIDANGLLVIHGHEYNIGGVNPSRKMALELKTSAIQGHLHRSESYNTMRADGQHIMCAVMGCLCTLQADYYGKSELMWSHGFGMLELSDGGWQFSNKLIIKGKVYDN